jgi:DNA (cytosine-5)-methyltransferase 1
VFVVATARDGFDPSKVLFDFEDVRRDTAPSRPEAKNHTFSSPRGIAISCYERHDQDSRIKPIDVFPTVHSKSDNICDLPLVVETPWQGLCKQCKGSGSYINETCGQCNSVGSVTYTLFNPLTGQGTVDNNELTLRVRRITPVECERLQGFPDNYTCIPWKNKPEPPDSLRYRAVGNSWAVPVIRWIGSKMLKELSKET